MEHRDEAGQSSENKQKTWRKAMSYGKKLQDWTPGKKTEKLCITWHTFTPLLSVGVFL